MTCALKLFAASLVGGWFVLVLAATFLNVHPFDAVRVLVGP